MSKQVDERVVSIQFDNRNFEKNVAQTSNTLEKFKKDLDLKGASKGLENVGTAAKKVDMSPLSNGVETVKAKFSAMEVIGVTALANITNSAVNAGKRILSALTIDPVKTGFNEYEMKMDSVRTIMASTGEDLKTVNKYLDELNEYSDQTIYSFSDMTKNIGKFTNAGVKLEDAVLAIKGISNEAAVSGANAEEASRAMYNFAQALSVGYVQRIDWKSIELANMGTLEFKNQLLDSAVAMGTVTKNAEGMYSTLEHPDKAYTAAAMFTETLDDQWLTTEVLIGTLKDYADAETDIGKKAFAAAQDVTKLSQVFDIAKEVAQSGWAKTWELIFGDLEQAKKLFTRLSEFVTKIQMKFIKFRNNVLEGALGRGFKKLSTTISSITDPIKDTSKAVGKVVESMTDYSKLVDEIIAGKWGNQPTRWQKLTEAGYDWAHAQNLVNEKLGDGTRHATKYTEAQQTVTKTQTKTTEANAEAIKSLMKLSDAQLRSKGYTNEQIEALRELEKLSKKLGIPVDELIKNLDEINGRWLLLKGFENIGKSIVQIFGAIKKGFVEAFGITEEGTANTLFNLIAGFHKLSTNLVMSDRTANNLKDTFKGVFSIFKIVLTIVGGPIKIAFKLLGAILKACGTSVLELTGGIGRAISAFSDWLDEVLDFSGIAKFLAPYFKAAGAAIKKFFISAKNSKFIKALGGYLRIAANAVKEWFIALKDTPLMRAFIDLFKTAGKGISKWIAGFKDADNIGEYIVQGLLNGIKSSIKMVWTVATELGKAVINAVKSILGIHSPSKVFFIIGGFIVAGLINGIQNMSPELTDSIGGIFGDIIKFVQGINLNEIMSMFLSASFTTAIFNITSAFKNFSEAASGLGSMLEDVGVGVKRTLTGFEKTLKGFGKMLGGVGASLKAKAIKDIAIAIAILVGAIFLMTLVDTGKVIGAVVLVGILIGAMMLLANSLSKIDPKQAIEFGKASVSLLGIAGALIIMAIAMRILGGMTWDSLTIAASGIVALGGVLMLLIGITKYAGNDVDKVSAFVKQLGKTLLLLAIAMRLLGGMEWGELAVAGAAIGGLALIIVGLIWATKLGGDSMFKAAGMLSKLGKCLLLMAIAVRLLGGMEWDELGRAGVAMVGLAAIIAGLIWATKLAGKNLGDTAKVLTSVGICILLLTIAAKILATMDWGELAKAGAGLVGLAAIIAGLIWATKLAGGNELKEVGKTLIMIAGAIAILALVATVLNFVPLPGLAKGIVAVGLLAGIMILLIKSTKDAQQCVGTIVALTVALAVLAAAIGILSFIDPIALGAATGALSVVMGMFALLVKSTKNAEKCIGTLIVLTVALAVMGGALYMLGTLNPENVLSSALGLAVLLIAMSGTLSILSKMGKKTGDAMKGALALLVLCVPLVAVAASLYLMKNVGNATTSAIALGGLLLAMTVALGGLAIIGKLAASGAMKGAVALLVLCVPLVAIAGILCLMNYVDDAITSATALGGLLLTMTVVLGALAVIGTLAAAGAIAGAVALLVLCVPLVAIAGILCLMNCVDDAMTSAMALMMLLTTMSDVCYKLALVAPLALLGVAALAALTALIVAVGALAVVAGALSYLGLETLIDKGLPILIKLAGGLGQMISAFLEGACSGLPQIGLLLSQFMTNAMPFITGAKLVDDKVWAGVKALTGAILLLTVADFIEGIVSFLNGGTSFATLGSELSAFIINATPFLVGAKMIDPSIMQGMKTLAEAILILTSANLLDQLASFFTGESSLSHFGKELGGLGSDLNEFVTNIGTFTDAQVTTVDCAARAIKALAIAAGEIPNTGGLWQKIVGESGLSAFSAELAPLGTNLSSFITNLGTFEDDQCKTVECAANAIAALAKGASEIPNTGGLWQAIAGEGGLSKFSGDLPKLGTNLSKFVKNLGTFEDDQIKSVNAAVKVIKSLATLKDVDPDDIEDIFKESLAYAAAGVKVFVDLIKQVKSESIESGVKKVKKLMKLAKDLSAIKEYDGELTDAVDEAVEAAETVAEDTVDAMDAKEVKEAAAKAGKNVVTGFANAIENNKKLATDAGSALGKAALNAAKKALDEHSPSKEMYKVGDYAGKGFINALKDNISGAYNSGVEMAKSAKNGLSNAIRKVVDMVNNDVDTQPTIRPVLDLSDVKDGANSIAGMFAGNRTLTVSAAGVGAISASMNNRQNGKNDLASAINKLAKSNNKPGNTYNFNGFNYSESSDVADAIQTLVRAAKMEGRT